MGNDSPIWLVRRPDRDSAVDALAAATGGRVGLGSVLADLGRRAAPAPVPGWAVDWGVALDPEDQADPRWWPQGVTTSADHDASQLYDGRRLVLTTSYARPVGGVRAGSRLSVFDLTDPASVRYAHVLLADARLDEDGRLLVEPLRVHAGGALWVGNHLHVAATARGLVTFHLDDIVHAPAAPRPGFLEGLPWADEAPAGHRHLLPARRRYGAGTAPGEEPMRYSFLSLERPTGPDRGAGLVVGEYARGEMTRRLVRYDLTADGSIADGDGAGTSRPRMLGHGVARMQGAVWVGDRLFVTASAGLSRGSMYVGRPGALLRNRWALPPGPEALAHWPGQDRLWSCSEHPGSRFLFTLDPSRLG